MRTVVIRTSALGDAVLTTPLLRALHQELGGEVEFVTSPAYAPLFEGLPCLKRVWPWPKGMSPAELADSISGAGPIDLVVDLQNKLPTFSLLKRLRGADSRRLIKRKGLGQTLASLVGADPILDGMPAAALYFDAVTGIVPVPSDLCPKVALTEKAQAQARALLRGVADPIVALAPGARWALKRWPPARFAEVGALLQAQGASLLLVGGPDDREAVDAVREGLEIPPIGETVDLDLPQLAAVLARSSVLITGDSGPSHLAQGVGTPVVAVFGPTSSRRWGPAKGAGAAVSLPLTCSPCSNYGKGRCRQGDRACLDALPAGPVAEIAAAALAAGRERGGEAAAQAAAGARLSLAKVVSRL